MSATKVNDLITRGSLYDRFTLTTSELVGVYTWIANFGTQFDAHCPGCGKETTFRYPSFSGSVTQFGNPAAVPTKTILQLLAPLESMKFSCARFGHEARVCLLMNRVGEVKNSRFDVEIQKIGQYPSHADLESARFKEYERYIDVEDLRELRRAAGLVSHGIGVGSFVYLRRIFERLIERTRAQAATDATWDGAGWSDLRMDEKVRRLRGHLPEFLLKNQAIYGIVSRGIHELSEDECLAAYPVLEGAILMILDEVRLRGEREKRIAQIAGGLQKLAQDVTSKD